MALVTVADIELDVERSGSGPPLLLIMGMSGTSLHWGEPFLSALRESFEVIAFDNRGVGASTKLSDGQITIDQMARDAAGLVAALGLDSIHVTGISMGGMIAQEVALKNPERVRTLTLGCTYCGGPDSSLAGPDVIGKLSEAMMSGDRERALRAGWEVNVSASFAADDQAWQAFRGIADRRAVAVPVIMAQMQACAAHDTHERLPSLSVPTLVIHGTVDQLIPVENGRLIASLIPDAELEILEGIGHTFFWELPERSAGLVREHAAVPA